MTPQPPKPVRLQRSCRKGARMVSPNGLPICYVGRPSKWGSPYKVGRDGTAEECVVKFREMVNHNLWSEPNRRQIVRELRSKNLACWCKLTDPCHADVLLELANGDKP